MFLKNGITDNKQWSVAEQHRTSSGFLKALTQPSHQHLSASLQMLFKLSVQALIFKTVDFNVRIDHTALLCIFNSN